MINRGEAIDEAKLTAKGDAKQAEYDAIGVPEDLIAEKKALVERHLVSGTSAILRLFECAWLAEATRHLLLVKL